MQQKGTLLLLMLASATVIAILLSWQYGTPIPNVTAIASEAGIGVYWDAAATNSCKSIDWGKLRPGSSKTLVVYLKNEKNESMFYMIGTEQWNPINASNYIALHSDYGGGRAEPSSVLQVSLILSVSPNIYGIVAFSFNIVIEGSPYMWGDINHDGKIDGRDIAITSKAFGSFPGDPNWNPDTDINGDGRVDSKDLSIISKNFGKTSM